MTPSELILSINEYKALGAFSCNPARKLLSKFLPLKASRKDFLEAMKFRLNVDQYRGPLQDNLKDAVDPKTGRTMKGYVGEVDALSDNLAKINEDGGKYLTGEMQQKLQALQEKVKTLGEKEFELLYALHNALAEGGKSDLKSKLKDGPKVLQDREKLKKDIEAFETEFKQYMDGLPKQLEPCKNALKNNLKKEKRAGERGIWIVKCDKLSDEISGITQGKDQYVTEDMKKQLNSLQKDAEALGIEEFKLFKSLNSAKQTDGNTSLSSDIQQTMAALEKREKLKKDIEAFKNNVDQHVKTIKEQREALQKNLQGNDDKLQRELLNIVRGKKEYLTGDFDDTFQSLKERAATLGKEEVALVSALKNVGQDGEENLKSKLDTASALFEERKKLQADIKVFQETFAPYAERETISKDIEAMMCGSRALLDYEEDKRYYEVYCCMYNQLPRLMDLLSQEPDSIKKMVGGIECTKSTYEELKAQLETSWEAETFGNGQPWHLAMNKGEKYRELIERCNNEIRQCNRAMQQLTQFMDSETKQYKESKTIQKLRKDFDAIKEEAYADYCERCGNPYEHETKDSIFCEQCGLEFVDDVEEEAKYLLERHKDAMERIGGEIKTVKDAKTVHGAVGGAYKQYLALRAYALIKFSNQEIGILAYVAQTVKDRSVAVDDRNADLRFENEVKAWAQLPKSQAEIKAASRTLRRLDKAIQERIEYEYDRLISSLKKMFGDYKHVFLRDEERLPKRYEEALKKVENFKNAMAKESQYRPTMLGNNQISAQYLKDCRQNAASAMTQITKACDNLLWNMAGLKGRSERLSGFSDHPNYRERIIPSDFS